MFMLSCRGGGKFSTGRNLPALKFFLSTDQPWSRKQHTTHPRQRPEGYKASHNPPLPNGRRVIQQFTLHPRQKARGLQSSKPPNLPWSTDSHSHLPVRVAWLPVSRVAPDFPLRRSFLYTGIPAQARSLLAPLCVHKTSPHPFATRGGSPTTLTLA